MVDLVWPKEAGLAVVVDWPVHILLAVASVEERSVGRWIVNLLVPLIAVEVGSGEETGAEHRRSHRQSTGRIRDATWVEEHSAGDLRVLRSDYFEVVPGPVDGSRIVAAIRRVAVVAVEVSAGCYVERVHMPELVVAIDRTVRTRRHIHCRRRDSATHPTQTAPGSTVLALSLSLARRPHGTDRVSFAMDHAFVHGNRTRCVAVDSGRVDSVASEEQIDRCSSPVWNRHGRRSMCGSWGRGLALLVKRGSAGRSNEGHGVRMQARMAFSWRWTPQLR